MAGRRSHPLWRECLLNPPGEHLLTAISAVRKEQQRHQALTDAQARAVDERYALADAVRSAEKELADARQSAPLDRVYAYVNRQDLPVAPLAEEQAAVTTATAALERARELGREIDDELQRSEARLHHAEAAVTRAIAPVIVESPEFQALFGQRTDAWIRLRTLYVLFNAIFSALSVNIPQAMCIRFQGTEPLEADRIGPNGPFLCDEELLAEWRDALTALRSNHLAPLPGHLRAK